jgi:hypothetical protein
MRRDPVPRPKPFSCKHFGCQPQDGLTQTRPYVRRCSTLCGHRPALYNHTCDAMSSPRRRPLCTTPRGRHTNTAGSRDQARRMCGTAARARRARDLRAPRRRVDAYRAAAQRFFLRRALRLLFVRCLVFFVFLAFLPGGLAVSPPVGTKRVRSATGSWIGSTG